MSSAASESPSLQDIQAQLQSGPQPIAAPQYAAPVQPFVTPAMWQESVASVYEGGAGLKRGWDYNGQMSMKRR